MSQDSYEAASGTRVLKRKPFQTARSVSSRFGMVSPPARRAQHTQTCSFASYFGFPHLPDLKEMSIRVMEEGPGLVAHIERRGDKLGSARAERLVGSRAVRNQNA